MKNKRKIKNKKYCSRLPHFQNKKIQSKTQKKKNTLKYNKKIKTHKKKKKYLK